MRGSARTRPSSRQGRSSIATSHPLRTQTVRIPSPHPRAHPLPEAAGAAWGPSRPASRPAGRGSPTGTSRRGLASLPPGRSPKAPPVRGLLRREPQGPRWRRAPKRSGTCRPPVAPGAAPERIPPRSTASGTTKKARFQPGGRRHPPCRCGPRPDGTTAMGAATTRPLCVLGDRAALRRSEEEVVTAFVRSRAPRRRAGIRAPRRPRRSHDSRAPRERRRRPGPSRRRRDRGIGPTG
jgi:hypothetical protein